MTRARCLVTGSILASSLLAARADASEELRPLPAAMARDAPKPETKEAHDDGPLGPVRLGATIGAGFPSLVSGQIVIKLHDWVGLTGSYGATPAVTFPVGAGASLSQKGFDVTGRVYPFRGAFFLGVGVGRSSVTGRAAALAYAVTTEASATTNTLYVLPEIGFLYRFPFGLSLGADFALQLPLRGSTTTSASVAGTSVAVPEDVRKTLAALEGAPMPVFHFLRIGWIF